MVLIDESGFLLAPLVRRTLAPRGQTPLLLQKGSGREKVSAIAALTLSPRRRRYGLYYHTLPDGAFDHVGVTAFLQYLLRHLPGPLIVVWDNGPIHRGPAIRRLLSRNRRLRLEAFPCYAPELNPVEQLWNHLKWTELCNYAADSSAALNMLLHLCLTNLLTDQTSLRSFFDAADLPFPTRALAG